MKLDGRRMSDNVDDRRGKGSGGKISLGIGATLPLVEKGTSNREYG